MARTGLVSSQSAVNTASRPTSNRLNAGCSFTYREKRDTALRNTEEVSCAAEFYCFSPR